jgi:prepilin-type N-terminal cleavage/methylation domain-containing protein
MNKRAFSLIELLIVVAIIAVLVGVAMPYYQDYVKETKLTKAKHELDILKEALIKYDTMEDRPFDRNDMRILLGRYLQDLPRDPWGRDYQLDYVSGKVYSYGPDYTKETDDIVTFYKPPLALQKAVWVDADKDRHISQNDFLRLEFSRILKDTGQLSTRLPALPHQDRNSSSNSPPLPMMIRFSQVLQPSEFHRPTQSSKTSPVEKPTAPPANTPV